MAFKDYFATARRELSRRKLRSLFTTTGYLLAVASSMIMINLLIMEKKAESTVLQSTGTHFMVYVPKTEKQIVNKCQICTRKGFDPEHEGFNIDNVTTNLFPGNYVLQAKGKKSVKDAAPYLRFMFYDTESKQTFTVGGMNPHKGIAIQTTCCSATDIVKGRFFKPKEDHVALLEEGFAKTRNLFPGQPIVIAGISFPIIGIINSGIRPAKSDVYLKMPDAVNVINQRLGEPITQEINAILVESKNSRMHRQALADVKSLLIGSTVSSYNCYKPAAMVWGINEQAVWILIGIILIGTLFFAIKTQSVAVIERRYEIGILRAVGWSNSNVTGQLLTESLIQAMIGGGGGCVLGIGITYIITLFNKELAVDPIFTVYLVIICLGLVLTAGILAGVIPAWQSLRLKPAEVIRRL